MEKNTITNSGVTFLELLLLEFVGLKLAGFIDWSWWWVFAPLWIPLLIIGTVFLGAVVYTMVKEKNDKK